MACNSAPMEWINPEQLPADAAGHAEQMLSFDMLRALIAARQSVSAARCAVQGHPEPQTGRIADPQSILRIFSGAGAAKPQTAPNSGQSDA